MAIRNIKVELHGKECGLDNDSYLVIHGLRFMNKFGDADDTSNPVLLPTAGDRLINVLASATATTGDTRAAYIKLGFDAAGVSGEAVRAYGNVSAAGTAAGGTVNGSHITLGVTGSGTITGAGNAIRATLDLGAGTTAGGTLAVIQADTNIATDANIPARTAFIRATNTGVGKLSYLLNLPTVASAGILAAHVTDGITHSIRCVDAAGTVFYIMCTTTATNRTGGA